MYRLNLSDFKTLKIHKMSQRNIALAPRGKILTERKPSLRPEWLSPKGHQTMPETR